mgnify:CR=1 FL=1
MEAGRLGHQLVEGGVDVILIETSQDILEVKAAILGIQQAFEKTGTWLPIQAQVTIELTGRMLPGTEIGAALAAIDPMRPDVFGINCATGPAEMTEHLRYLSAHARMPIAVIPNAGLPEVRDGAVCYDLSPAELADHHRQMIPLLIEAGKIMFAVDQQQYLQGYLPIVLLTQYWETGALPLGSVTRVLLTGPQIVKADTAASVIDYSAEGLR